MSTLVLLTPEAVSSLVVVDDQCEAVEQWAESCDSIPELQDANAKLAAITEYLDRTSTEGRARVATAMRRLEVRIGLLLGSGERGGDHGNQFTGGKATATDLPLTRHERSGFRRMAEHSDVVEQVIAESTDESPPSRRKVIDRINETRQDPPPKVRRVAPRSPTLLVGSVMASLTMAADTLAETSVENLDEGSIDRWIADLGRVSRSLGAFRSRLQERRPAP